MFNTLNPLNAFINGQPNAANLGYIDELCRKEKIDLAINYFIDLLRDDYDINDDEVQQMVFKRYGLDELSAAEEKEIIRKVEAAIA